MGVGGRSVASWDPLTNSTACPTDPGPRKAGEDQGTPEPLTWQKSWVCGSRPLLRWRFQWTDVRISLPSR